MENEVVGGVIAVIICVAIVMIASRKRETALIQRMMREGRRGNRVISDRWLPAL